MTASDRASFVARSGATYDVRVAWADDVATATERRLLVVLDAADLAALDSDELFHFVPAARPAELPLVPGVATGLELRPDVAVSDVDGASAAAWLTAHPDRLSTDRWFVTGIAQPDADPPVHASTLWAYAEAVGPDADPAAVVDGATQFLSEQHPELYGGLAELGGFPALVGAMLGLETEVDPFPALQSFLTTAEVEFTLFEDGRSLAFPVQGTAESWVCLAEVSQVAGSLVLYALLPTEVDLDRLAEAFELAGRFSSDRPSGTVQIDAGNGRTVVRTSLIVDAVPSQAVLRRLLDLNIEATDEALPIFARFADGASVEDALGG